MGLTKISFKKIALLFTLLTVSLTLTACVQLPFLGGGQKGPVTLLWWGLWEPEGVVKPLIEKYQSQNPNVKIVYEKQNSKQYLQRLKNKIAQDGSPDIFRFHNTWVPMLRGELAVASAKTIDKKTFQNTFYPVASIDLTNANGIVGIPLEYDGLALYWNEEIFAAAGIANPPKTWAELSTTAAKLTVKDDKNQILTSGLAMGTSTNIDHFSDILALMMLQNGVDLANPTARLNFATDALNWYTSFSRAGPESRVWDDTLPNSTTAFASGRLAMYFGPSWRVFEIKKANRNLKFKIAPVPQFPGGEKVAWASYWVEGVSAKSKNQEEAWKFLKFLSEKDQLQEFYSTASKAQAQDRTFGEPYGRVDLATLLKDDPLVGAYIQDAPSAKSWYMASATQDEALNDAVISFYKKAIDDVNHGTRADQALQAAASSVKQVLQKYNLLPSS